MASGSVVFELKDTSDNDKGLFAIWWSDKSGDPWEREVEVWRPGATLGSVFKAYSTTDYGTVSGATTSARRSSAQDVWDEYKSETGYEPGGSDHALEYIGDLKEIAGFDV